MQEPFISLAGTVVADPELRMSGKGNQWLSLRVVSSPRLQNRDTGEWYDGEPFWVNCIAYQSMAENIANTVSKGMRVIVYGKLTVNAYTDKQGQPRTSYDITVEEFGPSLRYATAQVTRSGARQSGGFGGMPQQAPGGAHTQAQSAWAAPAQTVQTPWVTPDAGALKSDDDAF